MKKRVCVTVLVFTLLAGMFSLTAQAAEHTYKSWDQGDPRWGSMCISSTGNSEWSMWKYGCYITAVAKLLVHAGQQDPASFTPKTCLEKMLDHGMLNGDGDVMYGNFNNSFLPTCGPELWKATTSEHPAWDKETAIRNVSDYINSGAYVIIHVNHTYDGGMHYMAVDYVSDDIYVMDNGGTIPLYASLAAQGWTGITDQVIFWYSGSLPYPAIDYIDTVPETSSPPPSSNPENTKAPVDPEISSDIQYRYHRYIDNNGEYAICPYYGNVTYNTTMHIEYTDWLDSRLPEVKKGYVNFLEHPYQGSLCDSAGCVDGATFQVHRHEDAQGQVWYYEETRVRHKLAGGGEYFSYGEFDCAKGHTWNQWMEIRESACDKEGLQERVCSVCGQSETKPIPALSHSWKQWQTVQEPFYGIEGKRQRTCRLCGKTETEELPALSQDKSTDNGIIGEYEPVKCDVDISDMQWSLLTLDEATVTESSSHGKLQLYVFGLLELNASCPKTERTISRIIESNIYCSPNVDIVFVDTDNNPQKTIRAFQEYYAPQKSNVTFAYGSDGNELLWRMVRKFGDIDHVGYTINFVLKDGHIVYAWHSETTLFEDNPRKYDIIFSKLGADIDIIETDIGATGGNYYFDKRTGSIIGADDTIATLNIPSTIDGTPVKKINDYAFCNCKNLTALTLSEGITEIGTYGISYCQNLSKIVIPSTVTTFSNLSFEQCKNLKDVHYNGASQEIYNKLRYLFSDSVNIHMQMDGMSHFTVQTHYQNGMFSDVKESDWFSSNVAKAYELGLMKGTGSGSFSPGNNVTLAEAVTLSARIHSIYHTGSGSFPSYDSGNWYDPYVDYAREHGLINTHYNYSRPANREEFAHILASALPEVSLSPTNGPVNFADAAQIVYSADVQLFQRAGVISGIRENGQLYFRPNAPITRAEVAAIIARMVLPNSRLES